MEDANLEPRFYEIADTSMLMAFRIIESGFIIKRSIIFGMTYVSFQEIRTL